MDPLQLLVRYPTRDNPSGYIEINEAAARMIVALGMGSMPVNLLPDGTVRLLSEPIAVVPNGSLAKTPGWKAPIEGTGVYVVGGSPQVSLTQAPVDDGPAEDTALLDWADRGESQHTEMIAQIAALRTENEKLRAEVATHCDEVVNRITTEAYDVIYDGEPADEREVRWKWVMSGLRDIVRERDQLKALIQEALGYEGAEGFDPGFREKCRAAGVVDERSP